MEIVLEKSLHHSMGPAVFAAALDVASRLGWDQDALFLVARPASVQRWEAWMGCVVHGRPFVPDAEVLWRLSAFCKIWHDMRGRVESDDLCRSWFFCDRALLNRKKAPSEWVCGPTQDIADYIARLTWWYNLWPKDAKISRV